VDEILKKANVLGEIFEQLIFGELCELLYQRRIKIGPGRTVFRPHRAEDIHTPLHHTATSKYVKHHGMKIRIFQIHENMVSVKHIF
jgi:hypothetical protein